MSKTKKQSVSSRLAELRKQRAAVIPSKVTVKDVKFTPEEMAYDAPKDTSHMVFVGRGRRALFAKPEGVVRLDEDVRQVFRDSNAVNNALRKLIEAMPHDGKRRKSA